MRDTLSLQDSCTQGHYCLHQAQPHIHRWEKKSCQPQGSAEPQWVPCKELRTGQRGEPGDGTAGRRGRAWSRSGHYIFLFLSQALDSGPWKVGDPQEQGQGARGAGPGSGSSRLRAGSVRCRAAGVPRRPRGVGGVRVERGAEVGSSSRHVPHSTGWTDQAAEPCLRSQTHTPLPGTFGGEQGGPAWAGGRDAESHQWALWWLLEQAGRKEGSVGLCACPCCELGLGYSSIIPLPSFHPPPPPAQPFP